MRENLKFIGKQADNPEISIVIVAYNTGSELLDCLDSLAQQTDKNFETILIDNDSTDQSTLQNYNLSYFWTGKNLGPSAARNIGLRYAKANIIAFLDDDGVTEKNWVNNILTSFKDPNIVALRGKIIPKNTSILNNLQSHYDMGSKTVNYYIDLEGNSAFRKEALVAVGGFESSLFGHEGAELSFKLQKKYPLSQIIYSPWVIIFHNYADSISHLIRKSFRHGFMVSELGKMAPEIINYINSFDSIRPQRTRSVPEGFIQKISEIFFLLGKITYQLRK